MAGEIFHINRQRRGNAAQALRANAQLVNTLQQFGFHFGIVGVGVVRANFPVQSLFGQVSRVIRGAAHANAQARRLAEGLEALGVLLLAPAESNQVFPILPDGAAEALGRSVEFEVERGMDGGRTCIRFVTAWHTPPEDVDALLELLA